jgi:hypothetical protein
MIPTEVLHDSLINQETGLKALLTLLPVDKALINVIDKSHIQGTQTRKNSGCSKLDGKVKEFISKLIEKKIMHLFVYASYFKVRVNTI